MVDTRFFGYATDDKTEHRELSNRFRHIVHTDRMNIPTMTAIAGTQKLHSIVGTLLKPTKVSTTNQWTLLVAQMPCACLSCRKVTTAACQFEHIRQEREVVVSEQKEKPPVVPRSTEHDGLNEQAKTLLGVDSITKAELIKQLRLRSQPTSGNKDVLARRLLSFEKNQSENPTAGPVERPLVRTFISEDGDLYNDDSDEED